MRLNERESQVDRPYPLFMLTLDAIAMALVAENNILQRNRDNLGWTFNHQVLKFHNNFDELQKE